MTVEQVSRVCDAQGAHCETCDATFVTHFWHWSKSKAMHESGTGHRVTMFRIVVPA